MNGFVEKLISKVEEKYHEVNPYVERNIKKLITQLAEEYTTSETGFISRTKVLQFIEDIKCDDKIPKNYGTLLGIMRYIRKMPGISNDGWIPVSEKPPEEGEYEVTIEYAYHRNSPVEYKTQRAHFDGHYWLTTYKVIAWMPLPEPYNPDLGKAKSCTNTECVYHKKEPCEAAEGCAGYEESEEQSESEQTPISAKEKEIIEKICECDMNVSLVAKVMYMHRNTVAYHMGKIKEKTGLDPMRFNDLVELRKMVEKNRI